MVSKYLSLIWFLRTNNALPQNSAVSVIYFLTWSCFAKCQLAFRPRPLPPVCKWKRKKNQIKHCGLWFSSASSQSKTHLCISRTVSSKISSRTFSAKMSAWFIVCWDEKNNEIKACTKQSVQDDIKIKSLGQVRKLTVCEASLPSWCCRDFFCSASLFTSVSAMAYTRVKKMINNCFTILCSKTELRSSRSKVSSPKFSPPWLIIGSPGQLAPWWVN